MSGRSEWTEEEMASLREILAGGTPIEQLFSRADSARLAKMLLAAERARLRERVVALRKGAVVDRIRAFDMEWSKDHAKLSERCDTLAEVLALLSEPEETASSKGTPQCESEQ